MDDLVERLREYCDGNFIPCLVNDLMDAAANRIEAQDKRNKELEAALRIIVAMTPDPEFGTLPIEVAIKVARAALEGKQDDSVRDL
jgi:hypothetical protein